MIRIRITRNGEFYSSLESEGHSPVSLGKKGENLLCSAVSVLVQTLYLHLLQSGKAKPAEIADGYLRFEVLQQDALIQTSFDLVLTGLKNLKSQYPTEIELIGVPENGT
ncbi:ribosomal-processing cysteine protease Prp [Leptospira yasudae]|uniref:Ribosomal processing cysteine protease Prp n=1 Tax=Leptospira yasudae TaxID=2202201 RepID=A0ABX9M2A2_9LEPT|nr:ribosomal-processing cysteine protease Prp [Leptospira yasudae]MBW0432187.1 ribosomal-processing cysteine protease Prp [Leptospira yasudae]RHX79607.1 ribosomal-processing cysteine protease Prp [Leptospira yasudae]RHX95605.1 ribosomal-processing cysteine protease Prp [Leptospira yasudae]TGK27134.1 ribosomal-processing cysteine protease Prp [Leptospira yasudae]TGM08073.1 ribosomal-processing cysteine protease Prp [Leptospira yasudae]